MRPNASQRVHGMSRLMNESSSIDVMRRLIIILLSYYMLSASCYNINIGEPNYGPIAQPAMVPSGRLYIMLGAEDPGTFMRITSNSAGKE